MNASITYDTRDNRLFPSNGQYHRLHAELADSVFGSELEFLRTQLIARKYQPIVWGLVLKLECGVWLGLLGRQSSTYEGERFSQAVSTPYGALEPRSLGFYGALVDGLMERKPSEYRWRQASHLQR